MTTKLTKRIATVAAKTKKLAAKVASAPKAVAPKAVAPKAKKTPPPPKAMKPRSKAAPSVITATAPDADAPRIECRLWVGDLSVTVDASSLSHTLGCADCAGKGLVDQWPDAVWTGLLVHLGLPADPLDRPSAEAPVKRLVQRLWYEAIKGAVPDEPAFSKRDAAKTAEYKETFTTVKETVAVKSERARTNFAKAAGRAPKADPASTTVQLVKQPTDKMKLAKRDYLIIDILKVAPSKKLTVKELLAAMGKQIITDRSMESIWGFHGNPKQALTTNGLITVS